MEAWQLEPGLITARWRVAFVAPLPPSPKLLELPEELFLTVWTCRKP